MNRIIYKNLDNSIAILIPVQEVLDIVGIQAIAEKDVPEGIPYWIVNATDIPEDRIFRNAWTIEGAPDGFGGSSNEFNANILAKLGA